MITLIFKTANWRSFLLLFLSVSFRVLRDRSPPRHSTLNTQHSSLITHHPTPNTQHPIFDVMTKKILLIPALVLLLFAVAFRLCCGIFVIQPMRALPNGASIIFWRNGLDMPFISSADGITLEKGGEVTLLSRSLMLQTFLPTVQDRQITTFEYSKRLYLISTGGKEYEK